MIPKPPPLLDVLTHRVRLLSLGQIARTWFSQFPCPLTAAKRHVVRHARLYCVATRMVRPELDIREPLLRWTPQSTPPAFGALAWKAKSRWHSPTVATPLVTATKKAREQTAARLPARSLRQTELTHDLHVAALYLIVANDCPVAACTWTHEDEMVAQGLRFGDHVPDACIVYPTMTGERVTLIEFAGQYSAQKLTALHAAYRHHEYRLY